MWALVLRSNVVVGQQGTKAVKVFRSDGIFSVNSVMDGQSGRMWAVCNVGQTVPQTQQTLSEKNRSSTATLCDSAMLQITDYRLPLLLYS
jgi:hypothetical protein